MGSKLPMYNVKHEWTLCFGYMSIYILKNIIVVEDGFIVDNIIVKDEESMII